MNDDNFYETQLDEISMISFGRKFVEKSNTATLSTFMYTAS